MIQPVPVPGPWRVFGSGIHVRCEHVVAKRVSNGSSGLGACNWLLISIGRRKRALVRVVAVRGVPLPPGIEGSTICCGGCGLVYEVEWWDRRQRITPETLRAVS